MFSVVLYVLCCFIISTAFISCDIIIFRFILFALFHDIESELLSFPLHLLHDICLGLRVFVLLDIKTLYLPTSLPLLMLSASCHGIDNVWRLAALILSFSSQACILPKSYPNCGLVAVSKFLEAGVLSGYFSRAEAGKLLPLL